VWRLDGAEALAEALRERAVFQRWIRGEPAAAIFVVLRRGAIFLGAARQLLGAARREWQYVGSIGPYPSVYDFTGNPQRKKWFVAMGDLLAQKLHLRGLVGVDFVLARDGPWVVEINPRYTASIEVLEQIAGMTAVASHVEACSGDGLPTSLPGVTAGDLLGKAILFAPQEAVVSAAFFEWAMARSALVADDFTLADIPAAGEIVPAGRPVLTAFARGRTTADCEARLNERLAEVAGRLYGGD
jgi:predicted ATP-grasp superfamily ATP-dependent carboligase